MLRFLPSRILLSVLLPLAPAAGATAQAGAGGTWRLQIHGESGPVQGRLVLNEREGGLTGELLLESAQDAPDRVIGSVGPGDSIRVRTESSPPVTLTGALVGDRLSGTVAGIAGRRTWSAVRLLGLQEYYPTPPRFRARQILLRERDGASRLEEVGLAAARSTGDGAAAAVLAYRSLSAAARLEPLSDGDLRDRDLLYAMGLYRREDIVRASRAVLAAIRDGLGSDTVRARFHALFRPNGVWLVDIHDVARERVTGKFPALDRDAMRAIETLPEVARERLTEEADRVGFGLYRLYVMSLERPELYRLRLEELLGVDPTAAAGAERYVQAYTEAAEWYRTAIGFFLTTPWFEGRSLADLLAEAWPWPEDVMIPRVRTHGYGYPEGSPRVMPAAVELGSLVVPENWTAREWLENHGSSALLAALAQLPREPPNTLVEGPEGEWIVTSVVQRREELPTGFLEPENAVVLDPSYVPMLALGTVVHEWLHLLHERRRLAIRPAVTAAGDTIAWFEPPALLPAEGLAEWLADVALARVIRRYPLIGVGEAAKRATMALTRPRDPHLAGYEIARALAGVLGDRRATAALLLAGMTEPDSILRHETVAAEWAAHLDAGGTVVEFSPRRWLVPETTFVIDDNAVFVVRRRIIADDE